MQARSASCEMRSFIESEVRITQAGGNQENTRKGFQLKGEEEALGQHLNIRALQILRVFLLLHSTQRHDSGRLLNRILIKNNFQHRYL